MATVRAAQAELRGRPSLSASVTGLVRRGETVEIVRSSADGRWTQVDIGGGELAWIEARALGLSRAAAEPEPERRDTLRMNRPTWARADEDRRSDDRPRRMREEPREEAPPPRRVREEPREVRDDPPPMRRAAREEPREEAPPPVRRAALVDSRELRDDPPPVRRPREEPREVRNDPPPKKDVREARNEPPPAKKEVARAESPPPPPKPVETSSTGRPLRDIPAAKPGEVFAADLDDERPPSGPADPKRK